MDTTRRALYRNLRQLAQDYTRLSAERNFLLNGVQERLEEINAERVAVLAEANLQLSRFNVLHAAAGEAELTLQQVRDNLDGPGPRV